MEVDIVIAAVDGVPHMSARRGREIYQHIVDYGLVSVLELGFAHGVSTCYVAAALEETGGHIVTMDRMHAKDRSPNIWELANELQLMPRITPVLAERSFTWELMKLMRDSPQPRFDFVFIDGGHTWDVTGFAFFLSDQLLTPGGWMLFDDLHWTMRASRSVDESGVSEEEATSAQVGLVFDLLVSPEYETRRDGNWGWARKRL